MVNCPQMTLLRMSRCSCSAFSIAPAMPFLPSVRAVAVEPENSAVLSGKKAGPHGLQGIGAGFVPEILDVSLIDEVIPVSDKNAYKAARVIARTDGVFAGISAGAAVWAAVQIAKRKENAGKRIAVIIPDTGMRYLSTELFSEEK